MEMQHELERFDAQFKLEALKLVKDASTVKNELAEFLRYIKITPLCFWLNPQIKNGLDEKLSANPSLEAMMLSLTIKFFAASNDAALLDKLAEHLSLAMSLDGPNVTHNTLSQSLTRNMPTNLLLDRFKCIPWWKRIFIKKPTLESFLKSNKLFVVLALVYVVEPDVSEL